MVIKPLAGYRDHNAAWDGKGVTVAGARNEWIAFQIIIEGGDSGLKDVTVTPSDLKSSGATIAAANYALFGEWYTEVKRPSQSPAYSMGPGMYPDGLVPMTLPDFTSFAVPAKKAQAIWVDLYIPADAAAGAYAGAITVKAADAAAREVPVALTVWDFALPKESHMRWRVGYNHPFAQQNGVAFDRHTSKATKEFLDLELKFYRMCRAHRVTPTTHYSSPLPDSTGKGETLSIDWASYDRRFAKYLDGSAFDDGLPVDVFSLPVNPQSYDGWPSSTRYPNRVDPASFKKAMELTVAHWKEKGWDLSRTFVYIADEPDESRAELIKEHCRIVKEADPRVHRSVAFYRNFGQNGPKVAEEYKGFVNMWEIAGDYMNRPALDGVRAEGDWVGIYQGGEPFEGGEALDMDGVALTTWPWIAWLYRLDTLFIYNADEWGTKDIWTDPYNHGWVTNSQGVLVYPGLKVGIKEALPSMRLKQMRRGMQDYEYFHLLKESGKGELADAVARRIIKAALQDSTNGFGDKVFGPGKWERDPAAWAAARREMAEAIAAKK